MIYGKEKEHLNLELAYDYLINAIIRGVTYFDEAIKFFKDNYKFQHGVEYKPPTNTGDNESFYYTRKSRKRK